MSPPQTVITSRIEPFRNSGTQFARKTAEEEEEIMNIKFTLLIFTMAHWVECGGFLVASRSVQKEQSCWTSQVLHTPVPAGSSKTQDKKCVTCRGPGIPFSLKPTGLFSLCIRMCPDRTMYPQRSFHGFAPSHALHIHCQGVQCTSCSQLHSALRV